MATFGTVTVVIVLVGLAVAWMLQGPPTSPAAYPAKRVTETVTEGATGGQEARPAPQTPAEFDRERHSTTDPRSIWVVVNKKHPIAPLDFEPDIALVRGYQVATAAAGPLARLLDAGDRRGLGLKIGSAYRSYGYQESVYQATVAARGVAGADRVSARPGHSEHQTGLGVDIVTPADPGCHFDRCFGETRAGRWLAREAWRYGFIVRYQPGARAITGYAPEPWHLRYVGRPLAAELRRQQVTTLEEFFGITGGDYRP
ncbi:M15 family metallopeptidase [Nocardioides speluncae]|uniref:M15 family metallopeptidase n=1 Tax=Nocardioides speluncae TaxID=2670337 RepID=UPI000D68F9B4|nr:M15 family metallopeptidase [Nocardioides speluncae]